MPQSHSKQKPTSPSATPLPSNKDSGEGLWMKGNIKLDHKQRPFEENSSTSPHAGQSMPSTEQSATVACDIAGSDNVSIIPWIDCYPDDPDKARELAISTGVPGIQVYPVNIFSHASDSQVINTVDAFQNSDESRAKMETQISPGRAADSEIESQTPVRTRHLTAVSDSNAVTDPMESSDTTKDVPASSGFCNWKEGNLLESSIEGSMSPSIDGVPRAKPEQQTGEQSKMRQGGVGTMGGSEKLPAGSDPETQNPRLGDIKIHAQSVNARNNPEVLGSGDIAQYFKPSNFPVGWGTEEGVDINSLLGNINEDKVNQLENVLDRHESSAVKTGLPSHAGDVDMDLVLDDGATKMSEDDQHRIRKCWAEGKSSSAGTTMASVSGLDSRDRVQETEPKSGSSVRHSTAMARKTITVTTSIEQVVTPNTGAAEKSKLQTEVKAIPPSNAGNTNAVSCLTPISITSDSNRATSTPRKTRIGAAQLRLLPKDADSLRTMELPEAYPLFSSDPDGLSQNNTPTVCGPGSCDIGQLSIHELGTSLSDLFDQTKDYGGTDVNDCLPPISEFVSWHDLTTAKNNTQPETGGSSSTTVKVSSFSTPPLSAVGAPVSKICTPSSAKTDVQVELAVEAEKPRDDSEAEDVADICGIDVDFDLNCGARRITEEDFVRLGLHNLSWAKLSDATTGPPSMSTEDLRGLKNASKDRPFLVGGANARDGSEENVTANKTGIDIGDSKLSVSSANSLRSMELVPPIDISGSQDSLGDALPGSSPKWQLPKADDEPQTIDSAKTPNVTNADRAEESGWVKVDMDTDNIPTQRDTAEGELHRLGSSV